MADRGLLKIRLLRDSDALPGAQTHGCAFGLQDNKGQIHAGTVREDGTFAFDLTLRVAAAADETQPPVLTGPFAFGRPQDRFVYLSW